MKGISTGMVKDCHPGISGEDGVQQDTPAERFFHCRRRRRSRTITLNMMWIMSLKGMEILHRANDLLLEEVIQSLFSSVRFQTTAFPAIELWRLHLW